MSQSNQVSVSVDGWQEGGEADFAELHAAIRAGMAKKYGNKRSDSASTSSEEDDEDPGEKAHPGKRQFNSIFGSSA